MSKNSEAADAEGASSSTKEEIIRGLNEDLAREYKAIIQYVVFSSTLKGADYGDIAEQLKVHASQELAHALEVAKQIDYLGADPTIKGKEAEFSQDSKTMLEIDLRAEQETIKNYRENPSGRARWRIRSLRGIKRYYSTGTRSRNRSERRTRIKIVTETLQSIVLHYKFFGETL
jgi:bacterioferritin